MDKQKKIMILAALGGLGLFLLSGRNASAAEFSASDEFGNTTPGGSSGSNTFTALLDKVLSADVDTSVQNIGAVDSFVGETNASPGNFGGNVKLVVPSTTLPAGVINPNPALGGFGGGGKTGKRFARN